MFSSHFSSRFWELSSRFLTPFFAFSVSFSFSYFSYFSFFHFFFLFYLLFFFTFIFHFLYSKQDCSEVLEKFIILNLFASLEEK